MKYDLSILLLLLSLCVSYAAGAQTNDSTRYPIPTISPICQSDLRTTGSTTARSVYRAGLRSSVFVVSPSFDSTMHAMFADYVESLHQASFLRASRYLSSLHHGISGSGVVVRYTMPDEQDTLFLVTSAHVVNCANEVALTVADDYSETMYRCRVLALSPLTDLALVEWPRDEEAVPLVLDTALVNEGLDVVAAGYPGLSGAPSWQLTKGSISNADLRYSHLRSAYQHTAPLDPGSSGGPLLIQTEEGYRVVGINTWKAFSRDGVGIAIPSREVLRFVHDYVADSTAIPLDTAASTAAWNELLKTDYVAASEALSQEVLCAFSGAEWRDMFDSGDDDMQTRVRLQKSDDPLSAVRMVIAYHLRALQARSGQPISLVWARHMGQLSIVGVTPPDMPNPRPRRSGRRH